MGDQRRRVPRSVRYMEDDDFGIREAVIKGVVAEELNAQTGREVVPAGAEFWVSQEGGKAFVQIAHKQGGRRRVVGGDKGPNVSEFVFGLFGYSEGARPADRSSPFLIILSGSKARVRSAAMSASPCRILARRASSS